MLSYDRPVTISLPIFQTGAPLRESRVAFTSSYSVVPLDNFGRTRVTSRPTNFCNSLLGSSRSYS